MSNHSIEKRETTEVPNCPLDPRHGDPKAAEIRDAVPAEVLRLMVPGGGNDELREAAAHHMIELLTAMKPRDPLERMLVEQLAWLHQRIASLSVMAVQAVPADRLRVANEALDRAINSFRRLMLGLKEYRAPHRKPNITAIAQLNQATQQNVALVDEGATSREAVSENDTNELGATSYGDSSQSRSEQA